jgi:4-hydroxy-3-polyprenylbenzoate decarboxylase
MNEAKLPLVVAITGASGAVYAVRLLETLVHAGRDVHLMLSPSGAAVVQQELGREVSPDRFVLETLLPGARSLPAAKQAGVTYHHYKDFLAPPASGSFLTGGMVVCPCSGSTLSAIAVGAGNNLIHRAADVHLKERRKLVLVPREAPVSLVHIDNMRRAAEAGAVILPASPGWYHGVKSIDDLVDFVVARILDQFDVPHDLMKRWGNAG